jgi:tRNA A37 N6-isopentenylltransferase MiaA
MNEFGPFDQADANLFSTKARAIIKDINQRGKVAIVEGGSLFYLKHLFEGSVNIFND